jgi:hypothetical protein
MWVGGKRHVPATSPPEKKTDRNRRIAGCFVPRAGLGVLEKRKICYP